MKNSGKYLEEAIESELKKNTDTSRHWRRLHDGRAAKNYIPAQPADFFLCIAGGAVYLESKSQKGKTRRLNKFSQLPVMQRWSSAGVKGAVVVHFHELEELFMVDVDWFDPSKPSWVLSEEFIIESLEDGLEKLGWRS